MHSCTLEHIPARLHLDGKAIVPEFIIGEELYYRCNPEECKVPYNKISLYDISHNRNFNDAVAFPKEDVLFNIDPNKEFKIIPDKEIVTILIRSLGNNNTLEISLPNQDPSLSANIKLLHDPVACMYTHCVFEVSVNNTVITKENYASLLDKKSIPYKNLRRDIRHELTAILFSSGIYNNSQTEVITEL